jgi:hypothetical protein
VPRERVPNLLENIPRSHLAAFTKNFNSQSMSNFLSAANVQKPFLDLNVEIDFDAI